MNGDFAFVDEVVPGIRWDAKYATWDNFTGRPVDGYLANRIVATRQVCSALATAQREARSRGLGLLLWDGYRPQRGVDCFVRWSRQAEDGLTKERHYPNITRADMFAHGYVAAKSGHSRGSSVDLTLYELRSGILAEMAGGHDLMDPVSHHGAVGITDLAASNRHRLRVLMESAGFLAYDSEWWHYTLRDEPFPDTYFDFPIANESRRIAREPAGIGRSSR